MGIRFTSTKLQGCCNDLFREPGCKMQGGPEMSNRQYLVACVGKFDLTHCPTVTPDFYHIQWPGSINNEPYHCCDACDCGWRFVSWEDVYTRVMEKIAVNCRYPLDYVDFKTAWGINQ